MAEASNITNPSRPVALGLFASAPAAAYFAAGAALYAIDPIFAAIEEHKRRDAEFAKTINLTDEVVAKNEGRKVTPADETAFRHASSHERRAMERIVDTVPVTAKGIRAALEYIDHLDDFEVMCDFCKTILRSPVLAV